MYYCKNCGNSNPEDSYYCEFCGISLAMVGFRSSSKSIYMRKKRPLLFSSLIYFGMALIPYFFVFFFL